MTVREQLLKHNATDFNINLILSPTESAGIDGKYPYDFFMTYYGDWFCKGDILSRWELYNHLHLNGLSRAYLAITAEYNPIHNYDMNETSTDEINDGTTTETRTTDITDTAETSVNVNTTATTSPNTTNTHSVNTYETGTTMRPEYTDSETGSTTTTTNASGEDNKSTGTNKTNGTVTSKTEHTPVTIDGMSGDRVEKHTVNRSGNIGVTTSGTMVTEELELRKRSIEFEYYQQFAIENFWFVGDGYDDNII